MASEHTTYEDEVRFHLRRLESDIDNLKKEVRRSSSAQQSLQSLEEKFQELDQACVNVINCNDSLREESKGPQMQMASLEEEVERLLKNQEEQKLAYFEDLKDMQKQINELKVLVQKTRTG